MSVGENFCSTCFAASAIQRARLDRRPRSPEVEERKRPELRLQLVAQIGRRGVDVGQLPAVGRIHRPRRDGVVRGRVHVVPPEQVGAGERRDRSRARASQIFGACTSLFDCFQNRISASSRAYQPLPTMPCVGGVAAGEVVGLRRAGDRGERRSNPRERGAARPNAPGSAPPDLHDARGQADDVEDDGSRHCMAIDVSATGVERVDDASIAIV